MKNVIVILQEANESM